MARKVSNALAEARQSHSIFNRDYMRAELATRSLIISHQQLELTCQLLESEFKRGLGRETNKEASVKMYPTHLIDRQDEQNSMGHFAEPEEGKFLALDLGGTNFRVILVELDGSNFHMDNEIFSLSQELMHGPGNQLFDYIAECLHKFVLKRNLSSHRLPLGFTFSFPIQQDGLAHARLVSWTKGFKCSGVEGKDVVALLKEAIDRRPGLDIEVMAVVNDTTGTLISCAFKNRECRIGLIVGTGTNACYMEDVDNVHCMRPPDMVDDSSNKQATTTESQPHDDTWSQAKEQQQQQPHSTVINTEWGAFGDNGVLDFVRNKWDEDIDRQSLNTGRQKFEKMISGLYIGEICRLIMCDMALNEKVLFQSSELTPTGMMNRRSSSSGSIYKNYHQQQQQLEQQQQILEQENLPCLADSFKFNERQRLLTEGKLVTRFAFETRFVSQVESDPIDVFDNTRRALKEAFGIDWASDQDCAIVKLICSRVSTRAAHLVSAAVACLLNKMARPYTVVGVDGSMFRYHPHFHSIMAKKTKELTRPEYKFQLMFSEDGSGRGAAIVASVACKQRRISREATSRKTSLAQVG
uniref:Phosphotransferase n=1 Tax=Aceria tosichella TaxID=561515 RepID=A0A6G1SKM7_9ACAR